ncbi:penicillin-binding protein activator [Otariodibacter sp.]|uniref:penicillin-binding protein activator n=1 Tax=Otariodibacter sp. TaxID=3030919 RepID=UPI0026299865|nr:penicillin-binding protein activator [Otariodibacter sp.]
MSTILVQSCAFSQKIKKVFVPTALAVFLSACTGTNFFTNEVTESLKNPAYSSSEFYINKADTSTNREDQQTYRLLAIRKLLDENKVVEAQNTIQMLNVTEFNELQRLEYNLLSARLLAKQNKNDQALQLLSQLPQNTLSQSQSLRVYETYAQVAENKKDVIETVRARALMDNYLTDNRARQDNNNKIWATLRNANRGMLEHATANPGEIGLAGWLSLIVAYNQSISNPSQLPQAIENWKSQYPNHSAAQLLPTELQNIATFQQTQLNSVALLLPLSGDTKILGDIIKKGFDDARGNAPTTVQVYDTTAQPLKDVVNQTMQQGIQTIVGPLLKYRVDEMLSDPETQNINVLALNNTPNSKAIAKVCYYGLAPEAEARSAANRFLNDGISTAIVIAPQDDFGIRSADAFAQRWRQLTNKDTNIRYYREPLEAIDTLRNNGVAKQSGVYLLGNATQLLELKQGLDNAGLTNQLSLYSSSRSNSPNNGPDFRLMMEGIKFSEIPLLADSNSDLYKQADTLAGSDFSMMRLYAMGSDSWAIVNKFNELRQIPGYKISGLTGVLSAGTNCTIERDMTWLEYKNGSIVPTN